MDDKLHANAGVVEFWQSGCQAVTQALGDAMEKGDDNDKGDAAKRRTRLQASKGELWGAQVRSQRSRGPSLH